MTIANAAASFPAPRKRVYFNEYNILMENSAYLPIVSGLLRAYAETLPEIQASYTFLPFFYHLDAPTNILSQYKDPDVAAFSLSMWNEQLNLHIAREIKARYPECLIVFGGAQVPQYPADYFKQFPFIDVAVRGEGEEAFADILTRYLQSSDFSEIPGVAWRKNGECVRNNQERPQSRDLDVYPSAYLSGLFETLITARPEMKFQAIIETNRGCPFPCTYCYWGQGGLSRKYRYHSMERLREEFEWIAKHEIRYVFNADSNFGMHPRDREIAQILVDTKKKYGFPEKFRTCFGKNTDDKIYEIAMMLHSQQLEKGITLARQSNDAQVLRNIRRQNIKIEAYNRLQLKFNAGDVPVYSELILGLPGETYETWITGIEEMLQSGIKNQLFVYLCQVYPNTEMAAPEYQKEFGIITKRIELTEIHGKIRSTDLIPEFEDIVITTNAMSLEEWKRMVVFSWTMMVFHSLKIGFFVMQYLFNRYHIRFTNFISYLSEEKMPDGLGTMLRSEIAHFRKQTDLLLAGHGRGRIMPEYGKIYWDEEEASFLRISENLDGFYSELGEIIRAFLHEEQIKFSEDELREVMLYQRLRIPSPDDSALVEKIFTYNFPEFFQKCHTNNAVPVLQQTQKLAVHRKQYGQDLHRFARETILWGRKSGTMMTEVSFEDGDDASVTPARPAEAPIPA